MRVQSKSVPRRPCSSNQTIFCLCRGAEVALALAGVRGPQQSKLERWIGLFLSLILWLVWNLFMGKVPWVRGSWPKIVGQHSQHWKILSGKILQFVKLLQFRWKCCKSVASGSERWLPTDTSPSVWQQQGLQSISQVLKNTFTIWLFWLFGNFWKDIFCLTIWFSLVLSWGIWNASQNTLFGPYPIQRHPHSVFAEPFWELGHYLSEKASRSMTDRDWINISPKDWMILK